MFKPGLLASTVYQGAAWSLQLKLKDSTGTVMDLTGYTARAQIRQTKTATVVLAEMSTVNGAITIAAGVVTLSLTPAQTSAIKVARAVYDLELTPPSGASFRLVEGTLDISKEVTR
jgi:membrane protein YqaA with SNARE-associated domain